MMIGKSSTAGVAMTTSARKPMPSIATAGVAMNESALPVDLAKFLGEPRVEFALCTLLFKFLPRLFVEYNNRGRQTHAPVAYSN